MIKNEREQATRQQVLRFTKTARRSGSSPQYGYRPLDTSSVYQEFIKQFPVRPGDLRIDDKVLGGWRAVEKKWFDPNKGIWSRHRAARATRLIGQRDERRHHAPARDRDDARGEGRHGPLAAASSRCSCSVVVVLPIAALVWESTKRVARVLGGRLEPAGGGRAEAELRCLVRDRARSTPCSGTIIAWVLVRDEFPRQGRRQRRSSTCRSRCRRSSPGLTLIALYGPTLAAFEIDVGVHANRDLHGAALRHAALRRPHSAARAARARRGDGAGGAVARRRRARVFRRVILPNILPGILSGVALAFARAVGEIGSLVMISGNLPFKTEVASVYILSRVESRTPQAPRRSPSCCSSSRSP